MLAWRRVTGGAGGAGCRVGTVEPDHPGRAARAAGRSGAAELRGRSPAGQLRSGVVASLAGTRFSLVSGGFLCAGAVAVIAALLPGFIRPGNGGCPAAQGSAGHRADGVLGRPVPTHGNDMKADKDRKILSV